MKYKIVDWANNLIEDNFSSFDDAEYWISVKLGDNYDEDRQEYYIKEYLCE